MAEPRMELKDRTTRFASRIVRLYIALPRRREEVAVLGKQMLRSGTSVAANFREASRARSDAEFVSKLDVCTQEADETQLWLELLRDDCGIASDDLNWLHAEADELMAIFVTISRNRKRGNSP
jgi:four helix bundle protein